MEGDLVVVVLMILSSVCIRRFSDLKSENMHTCTQTRNSPMCQRSTTSVKECLLFISKKTLLVTSNII